MTDKQLWLLRHARADAGDKGMDDTDRPLSHDGRDQATRLGQWLAQQDLRPGLIVSSPAVRARQTTELICRALGVDLNHIRYDPGLYLASRNELLGIIEGMTLPNSSVMLVGHNPGLEELLGWLCPEPLPRTQEGQLLTTANLARIRIADNATPAEGSGQLIDLIRADELA
ncbi:SixA phosphatase family protein [Thiohalophilus thiocyanatoxydans]|uniref:Phosphohistidine phosphatase SixA n=1 Tax=Thiohalophilus thiocyanatoxydans TaxID=381308 RepID=A0A4R8IJQ1_9GAMM|nr:histidine phosphatase family protein [Thiohalophilus thiocyanatoxydans]TDY00962.1 phosphohistidine phosphatase SixA [Thiohalophilus thiocyanatoxydans]